MLNLKELTMLADGIGCLEAVKKDGLALQYVKHQTPELCLSAVKQNALAFEYVQDQTFWVCLAAVGESGFVLKYVKTQTPEICLTAVKNYGHALEHVEIQSLEICMAAVNNDGYALKHVKHQTPELCMAAVKQNGCALECIEKQTPALCIAAFDNDNDSIYSMNDEMKGFFLKEDNEEEDGCIEQQEFSELCYNAFNCVNRYDKEYDQCNTEDKFYVIQDSIDDMEDIILDLVNFQLRNKLKTALKLCLRKGV